MPRLSEIDLSALQEQAGIRFLGATDSWPRDYLPILERVRQISGERLNDSTGYGPAQPNTVQLKIRAGELAQDAEYSNRNRVNEATLRARTEHAVFRQLVNEAHCTRCELRSRAADASGLNVLRQPSEAPVVDVNASSCNRCAPGGDTGRDRIFADCCQRHVAPDPSDSLAHKGLPKFEPDRVFGLDRTGALKEHTNALRQLRHSPFQRAPHIIYPFLVVESKSGGGNADFVSIDTQTAFPLRTCLMLQKNLGRSSTVGIGPLVWYIAYKADAWRLSACVLQDDKMQVHHMWEGLISREDDAFQLLHIVDYLCEWCRNVYRPQILDSLLSARRENSNRRTMPVRTTCNFGERQSQHESIQASLSASTTTNAGMPSEIDIVDLTIEDTGSPAAPSPNMVCRHANSATFVYEHFAVPEDPVLLSDCLITMGESAQQTGIDAADWLRALFAGDTATTMTMQQLEDQQRHWRADWYNAGGTTPSAVADPETLMRVCAQFETYLEAETWRTIRKLRWLTCSHKAATLLLELPGNVNPKLEAWVNTNQATSWPPALFVVDPLQVIAIASSLQAAALHIRLVLNFDSVARLYTWSPADQESMLWHKGPMSVVALVDICAQHFERVSARTYQNHEIVRHDMSDLQEHFLLWRLPEQTVKIKDYVLLLRGEGWPDTMPASCLVQIRDRAIGASLSGGTAGASADTVAGYMSAIYQGRVFLVHRGYAKEISLEDQVALLACPFLLEDGARLVVQAQDHAMDGVGLVN